MIIIFVFLVLLISVVNYPLPHSIKWKEIKLFGNSEIFKLLFLFIFFSYFSAFSHINFQPVNLQFSHIKLSTEDAYMWIVVKIFYFILIIRLYLYKIRLKFIFFTDYTWRRQKNGPSNLAICHSKYTKIRC